MKTADTLVLAHHYTEPAVKEKADFVGDSLELALKAVSEQPKRIVFAGVRFMAETAKILLPDTEVILPHPDSTCSLVTQTLMSDLKRWRAKYPDHTHVMYINSSAEMKTLADIICTSANVQSIISNEIKNGRKVIFSPDRNMGAFFNYEFGWDMPIYTSVCEVHDKFKEKEISRAMRGWTDGPKFLLAHPEAPLPVLKRADFIGSTSKMLKWVEEYPHRHATIFVATEEGLLYAMRLSRPELDIRQAPTYTGCACNVCPYMRKNTPELVDDAILGRGGVSIDYLTPTVMENARLPIERMMEFSR